MSRQTALDNICLRPTERFAHTEYSLDYHESLKKKFPGKSLNDVFDIDFLWCVNDGPIDWKKAGRATDMGHAGYAADGSDQRNSSESPFHDIEEIYEFDPAKEYGLPSHEELVKHYQSAYDRMCSNRPNQLSTGGYYKTVVSGAIESFGWEMLLVAAADKAKFAKVLERFGKYTAHYAAAWADTSIEAYIQHDDMVWTEGPFMEPEFYRSVIFPLYKKMWEPLKKKDKKILYCSDGTFDMFMKDIADCGADGFIFEPTNNLDYVVENFGSTHCIVGSKCDCRTMAFNTWEDVKREMDETAVLARKCKGFIWAVGNHIPANVSDEICLKYLDYLRKIWKR